MKGTKRLVLGLIALTALLTIYGFETVNCGTIYSFMKVDHPVDMEQFGGARWFYYSLGRDPDKYAAEARKELLAKGFKEDFSQKPWYRFTKGGEVVIVCNHDDIMTMFDPVKGESLAHMKMPAGTKRQNWTVVWERQPGGSKVETAVFKIKKTVLLW